MDHDLREEIISLFAAEPVSDETRRRAEAAADHLVSVLDLSAWTRGEVPDDLLAFLAVARLDLPGATRDETDARVFDLMSLSSDAERLRARWDTLTDRMAALDSASNAAEHFQRISGRRLDAADRVREPDPRDAAGRNGGGHRPAPTRGALARPVRSLYLVRILSTAAVIVLLVGVTGRLVEPRLALDARNSLEQMFAHRGASPGVQPEELGIQAGDPIEAWGRRASSARRVWMGLWPIYDTPVLEGVENDIASARDTSSAALLVLGKVRLMRGDGDGARSAFTRAARSGNSEAAEWIRRLTAGDDHR